MVGFRCSTCGEVTGVEECKPYLNHHKHEIDLTNREKELYNHIVELSEKIELEKLK